MEERFGFIRSELDIKILILFVLRRLVQPVDLETLTDLTLIDDGISYFDFADCVSDLVRTGHVLLKSGLYSVSEKGAANGAAVESSLPYSVRVKAEKAAAAQAAIQARDSMITASSTVRRRGGCTVQLGLSDGVDAVLDLAVLVPDAEKAEMIQKHFRAHAEQIYKQIMELLLQ